MKHILVPVGLALSVTTALPVSARSAYRSHTVPHSSTPPRTHSAPHRAAPRRVAPHQKKVHLSFAKLPVDHVDITTVHGKYAYAPKTITIRVGKTVTWTNNTGAPHTVTESHSKWTSNGFSRHGTYSHHFTAAGTFHYVCAFHGYMTGTIVVRRH